MFSCDLKLLASYSEDETVRVWDVSGGRYMQTLTAHTFVERFLLDDSDLELASNDVRRFFEYNPDLELFDSTLGFSSFCMDGPDSKTPDAESHFSSYGISQDSRCTTWNLESLLWLPQEFRPGDEGNS